MQAVPNVGDPVLGGNNQDRVGYVRKVSPSVMADLCGQSAFWVTIVWLDPDATRFILSPASWPGLGWLPRKGPDYNRLSCMTWHFLRTRLTINNFFALGYCPTLRKHIS